MTRRLPHEELEYDDERFLIHFYNTFCNESIKLLGKKVRCWVNVLYHLLAKISKEPNADLFQFMKGDSHQRTEEEIKFVFERLGWNYSRYNLIKLCDISICEDISIRNKMLPLVTFYLF